MPTATAPIANCDIPSLTIDFYFARYDIAPDKVPIKDEYGSEIKSLATWLENHPACKVLVEGHASTEGSNAYNDGLADNRAQTLYNLLRADGVPESQLEHASFGKYFPRHDYNSENRRDILVVQGPASGR
jgi:outer membrane protein OmpA-like peptidoglycan-associated protein